MATIEASKSDPLKDQLEEIARAALERSYRRRAEEAKRLERAKLEHETRFAAAAAALQLHIIPLLQQAKLAFESEGVPVEIITNFTETGAPQAHVAFECCGSFWSNAHGNVELAASDRAIFSHDGIDLHVGVAKCFSKQIANQTRVDGEVGPRVLDAVEAVVDSFFRDVERRCR